MRRLEGDVAFITGSGSGIGRAIALAFSENGAAVVCSDIRGEAAAETVEMLPTSADSIGLMVDVVRSDQVETAFQKVASRYGRLSILVNNAGITEGAPGERERLHHEQELIGKNELAYLSTSLNISDASWKRMLDVHLSGAFYCTRSAIPLLTANGKGCVINMSSMTAIGGHAGLPHYGAAKTGLLGLTRSMAVELGPRGIRVNAILPGVVTTPWTDEYGESWSNQRTASQPIARAASPEEIAATAVFLASEDAQFYTGQCLSPNGGAVMYS
jgi:3-oxoacyl-[acyl-carrier protein] reductase